MKLFEHMAKDLFRRAGIPVPRGEVATSPEQAEAIARRLGPVAVKAQVLAGGRGKAGGIRLVETPEEAREAAAAVLAMELKGLPVEAVYVEEKLVIDRELYLAVTVDTGARKPVLIASASGGVEIELVPGKAISRAHVSIQWGLQGHVARGMARELGLSGPPVRQFSDIAMKLYDLFRNLEAETAEINPLVLSGRRLIAADARCTLDDDALFRNPGLPRVFDLSPVERKVRDLGLIYVQLDGDIAVMANGAGMAMATLDILQRFGGRPMNFLDAGGGAAAEPMARALEVLISTGPRVVLVNIFGGITRCDDVARAILAARDSVGMPMPLVVRLLGTNEEEGIRLLADAGINAFRSMEEAAHHAVSHTIAAASSSPREG